MWQWLQSVSNKRVLKSGDQGISAAAKRHNNTVLSEVPFIC